jgi:hypothetical protein
MMQSLYGGRGEEEEEEDMRKSYTEVGRNVLFLTNYLHGFGDEQ